MNNAFVFIGSNVDRERNYIEGLARLAQLGIILRVSSIYETAPVGDRGGGDFYNGAALLGTELIPRALKDSLRSIETDLGRVRTGDRYAPRTLDLDLVLYNRDRIEEPGLHIPDPLILQRPFMAVILAELTPDYVLPGDGRRLLDLAAQERSRASGMRLAPLMTARVQELYRNTVTGEVSHA